MKQAYLAALTKKPISNLAVVQSLRPSNNLQMIWTSEPEPSSVQIAQMHHQAHEKCFIANSVLTDIRIE